ncbi:MAG: efflux RND transporter periplasmic adaptor subunit [Burkholderiales bacterium]|nr:efflux RND transporter periplasmic adaptor subunit [Burkholderiales bacterium]
MAQATRSRALALVAVVLVAACGQAPPPKSAPPAAEVTVVKLQPETVTLTRELAGRVNPLLVAEVRPQVGGIITRRLFTEGGRVKAGQPLYQLDDAIPRADQATAKAALGRAQATLHSARLNAARSAELAKIDAVSKQDDENAIAALRQAEADVASAQATLARGDVILAYARITSPITGRIGKSSVTQGALVTANQADALATVQQLDPIYVDVTQSSAELLDLRKQVAAGKLEAARDLPVTILLEDGTRYPQQGKLTFEAVTVDPTTGSYLLRIVVPNPGNVLLPGMYVRAVVGSGVRQNALLVPQQGITRDPKGDAFAMLLGADSKVQQRPVKVSRTIGDRWLVEEGLAAGDQVIVEGLQKIRPGMPARAAPPAPANAAPAGSGPGAVSPASAPPPGEPPTPPATAKKS